MGKTLIIGGASGIGFAVASALADRENELVLAGRNNEKLESARQLLNGRAAAVSTRQLDVSNEAEVIALSHVLGDVDNIVFTAGSYAPGGFLSEIELTAARLAFDTKFWGSIYTARHLSGNIRPRGTLTLTSGFLARRTLSGTLVKSTMNAAIESAAKVLAKELAPLRVNVVSPGLTDTEAYAGMDPKAREKMLQTAAENLPVKAYGRAQDIAKGYLFLLDNPFVTGTVIDIEGGALIN
ncbi:putative oxidoreductase (plasmid) [Pantoea sp. Nvir]|uniref:SDR family oxidoreductase n=1 Tax=Pantoea TaxID=53335 RepID=UPI000CDDCA6A|nr:MULTISPECIES: SDR family oxidoreductase [Pantoea]POW55722.1 dehydrogenase [Pantoea alvi]UBN52357.1 SDR family oxidoreductase [Pantoea agglomerans]